MGFKLFFIALCSVAVCSADNPTLQVPGSLLLEPPLAVGESELDTINTLIHVTEEQLKVQLQLKELMQLFERHKEDFIQGDQSRAHTSRLVHSARHIHIVIQENHLEHLFGKEYLDELQFFSSIAGKSTVKRP